MPTFTVLSPNDVAQLAARNPGFGDSQAYVDYVQTLAVGDWGEVEVLPGENKRAVKNRLFRAAKAAGKSIHWLRRDERERSLQKAVFVVR